MPSLLPSSAFNDDSPDASGTLLFDRYRVRSELGRGGMGIVLLAQDEELDVPVAIKIVPPALAKDPEAVSELKKEVLRGMALMHPGIVRTNHFEREGSTTAIVMEYIDGLSLTELKIKQPDGCFDPERILPWIEQICAVLDYAHRDAKIAHRDLKPRNILLTADERIKVADFGISSSLTQSWSRIADPSGLSSGTPPYMSPQQARGQRPSHLDDIYALGATIYDLLTGKAPFFRGNIHEQVLTEVPPRMEERRRELGIVGLPEIPTQWEETVAACLAKDPNDRPQSAREVYRQLTSSREPEAAPAIPIAPPPLPIQTAEPESSATRRTPPPLPAQTNHSRWKAIILGGSVLSTILFGALVWSLVSGNDKSEVAVNRSPENQQSPVTAVPTPPQKTTVVDQPRSLTPSAPPVARPEPLPIPAHGIWKGQVEDKSERSPTPTPQPSRKTDFLRSRDVLDGMKKN